MLLYVSPCNGVVGMVSSGARLPSVHTWSSPLIIHYILFNFLNINDLVCKTEW